MSDYPADETERDPAPLEGADAERDTDEQAAQVPSRPTQPADGDEDPPGNPEAPGQDANDG